MPRYNHVVYAIIGLECYFSGIERQKRTSTVNAAESIISAISQQQGIPIVSLRWFDIKTNRGYGGISKGQCEVRELILGPTRNLQSHDGGIVEFEFEMGGETALVSTARSEDFQVVEWRPTEISSNVKELFLEYIGIPREVAMGLTPDEARRDGYSWTDESDTNLEGIIRTAELHQGWNIDRAIVIVDNTGFPSDLAKSKGFRYTMWWRDDTPS